MPTEIPALALSSAQRSKRRGLLDDLNGPREQHGHFQIREFRDGSRSSAWITAPHVVSLLAVLQGGNVVYPFDWTAWSESPQARALLTSPDAAATAPLDDVRRALTVVVRSERFDEGSLAFRIESGIVGALVLRLLDHLGPE